MNLNITLSKESLVKLNSLYEAESDVGLIWNNQHAVLHDVYNEFWKRKEQEQLHQHGD